ncbi:MAG: DUF3810 domain-containing protein [Chitinophagales bacterium]
MWQTINKWKWIIMSVLCIILRYVLPALFIEKYYSLGLFRLIRNTFDYTFGKLPFPSYYLFLLFLIIIVTKWILHFFREKPEPFLTRCFKIVSFIGFLITFFFIFWGFNYGRISIEQKLGLQVKEITPTEIRSEIDTTIASLVSIRNKIKTDTTSLPQIVFVNNIEDNCSEALNASLSKMNYNTSKVRGRFVFDDLFLLFGIGGQYLPFVGEGNVDDAVFHSKKPFYLMHEMTHGNGFTEEADCNFMAYVACMQSDKLPLQYSGELNYLIYLLSALRSSDSTAYKQTVTAMPKVIQIDLEEIRLYNLKHDFKIAKIGDAINNIYLKLNGVKDGTNNYDKMVLLIYAWKHKMNNERLMINE